MQGEASRRARLRGKGRLQGEQGFEARFLVMLQGEVKKTTSAMPWHWWNGQFGALVHFSQVLLHNTQLTVFRNKKFMLDEMFQLRKCFLISHTFGIQKPT